MSTNAAIAEIVDDFEAERPQSLQRINSFADIAPVISIEEAVARHDVLKSFVERVMEVDHDYGQIPGTKRNTLLKPGAEKLTTLFGLTKKLFVSEKIEDWTGIDHGGEPFFYYLYTCALYRGNLLIAESDGSCNSWESKYRYRNAERLCPGCGQPTIIRGKAEYGGGWICFQKKGGCGAKFPEGMSEIEEQQIGRVANPDIADVVNTVQKMAAKRALIATTLLAVNASEFFTQDVEDFQPAATQPRQRESQPARQQAPAPEPEREERTPDPFTAFWMAAKAIPDFDGKAFLAKFGGDPVVALGEIHRSRDKGSSRQAEDKEGVPSPPKTTTNPPPVTSRPKTDERDDLLHRMRGLVVGTVISDSPSEAKAFAEALLDAPVTTAPLERINAGLASIEKALEVPTFMEWAKDPWHCSTDNKAACLGYMCAVMGTNGWEKVSEIVNVPPPPLKTVKQLQAMVANLRSWASAEAPF